MLLKGSDFLSGLPHHGKDMEHSDQPLCFLLLTVACFPLRDSVRADHVLAYHLPKMTSIFQKSPLHLFYLEESLLPQ